MKNWQKIALGGAILISAVVISRDAPITVEEQHIVGDYYSDIFLVPEGNDINITANIPEEDYTNTSKTLNLSLQFSDDGEVWKNGVGCGFKGTQTYTNIYGETNPQPSCGMSIKGLTGKKMRLHMSSPDIRSGAVIEIQ